MCLYAKILPFCSKRLRVPSIFADGLCPWKHPPWGSVETSTNSHPLGQTSHSLPSLQRCPLPRKTLDRPPRHHPQQRDRVQGLPSEAHRLRRGIPQSYLFQILSGNSQQVHLFPRKDLPLRSSRNLPPSGQLHQPAGYVLPRSHSLPVVIRHSPLHLLSGDSHEAISVGQLLGTNLAGARESRRLRAGGHHVDANEPSRETDGEWLNEEALSSMGIHHRKETLLRLTLIWYFNAVLPILNLKLLRFVLVIIPNKRRNNQIKEAQSILILSNRQ